MNVKEASWDRTTCGIRRRHPGRVHYADYACPITTGEKARSGCVGLEDEGLKHINFLIKEVYMSKDMLFAHICEYRKDG